MTEDVLISIQGMHTFGNGQGDDITVTFPGKCRKISGTWYLQYEEPVEGSSGMIRNLIRLRRDSVEVTKRGLIQTNMVFETGKRHETVYETPMGRLRLGIVPVRVDLDETEQEISAQVDYALEAEGQRATDCRIRIRIVPCGDRRRELPIGVFDSGVGGISVLRAMVSMLPGEDFLYFGDSANAPYGTKPVEEIRRLTISHAADLYQKGIKALVVACNTATSAAITQLREIYRDIPVIGIEPALKPAVTLGQSPVVVVMATPQTVVGNKFRRLLEQYAGDAQVITLPCPGLMEHVERGELNGEAVEQTLHSLLDDCLSRHKADAIVLGCTHYPFLKDSIRKVAGDKILLMDGSEGTARELKRRLQAENLLREDGHKGQVTFEMSLPEKLPLCRKLLEE